MYRSKRALKEGRDDGYTFTELMVTVVVIGVIASIAVPQYVKSIERGYWSQAREIMRAIYNSEHVYESFNNEFYPAPPFTLGPCDISSLGYAPCRSAWVDNLYMDDPNTYPSLSAPVRYQVFTLVAPPRFFVTVFRQTGLLTGNAMLLDQDRTWIGDWGDPAGQVPP